MGGGVPREGSGLYITAMIRLLSVRTALLAGLVAAGISACTAALGFGSEVTEVSVVVLSFDPRLPGRGAPTLRKETGGSDPRDLADSLRSAAWDLSLRKVAYRIVDWRSIDAFPPTVRSPGHDTESYRACLDGSGGCPELTADIPAILERYGMAPLIDRHIADEVWIFAGPHLGVDGAAGAGPGAVVIDDVYPDVAAARPFTVMGFSYAQGMTDVLHTLCRRVERTVGEALRETAEGAAAWARFTATAGGPGTPGVGTCDTPPNATEPFVYDSPDPVTSTAPAWFAYPEQSDATQQVSAAVWNGPDYRRSYLRWWFQHIPHTQRTPQPQPPANWWPLAFGR